MIVDSVFRSISYGEYVGAHRLIIESILLISGQSASSSRNHLVEMAARHLECTISPDYLILSLSLAAFHS